MAVQCEVDFLEGLAPFVKDELTQRFGSRLHWRTAPRPDALAFDYTGTLEPLLDLRSAVAVSLVRSFPVPRPKALLGHQHFGGLLAMISEARALWPPDRFATLRIGAAGDDSPVMLRLAEELAQHTGLRPTADEADLLLRLRPAPEGWQALVRLSPRPLATRPWRVCNMPGALNASVAHVLMRLTEPRPGDRVLNMACGSGTLLIERLALESARQIIGCDTALAALACATQNIAAARGHELAPNQPVQLEAWDATATPLPDASVDVICADLPFGQLIGTHRQNETLYPQIFAEVTRLAAPNARLALISHELRLLEQAAVPFAADWQIDQIVRVRTSGMTPGMYVWRKQ